MRELDILEVLKGNEAYEGEFDKFILVLHQMDVFKAILDIEDIVYCVITGDFRIYTENSIIKFPTNEKRFSELTKSEGDLRWKVVK